MNNINRNILSSVSLFILLQVKVLAQSPYVPFPGEEAVWHVIYTQPDYGVGKRHDQYAYAGDTTINGSNWQRLSYKSEWIGPGGSTIDYGIIGYVGQDSIQKKVYYMPAYDSVGHLLYDFDLQAGSLYPQTFTHTITDSAYVTKIDSILAGNTFRRVFIFGAGLDTLKLIEGIGVNAGLLSPVYSGYCFEYCSWLTCFQQEGVSLYTNSFDPLCNMVTVNQIENQQQHFSIQPNLLTMGEQFYIFNTAEGELEISVLDIFGNLICKRNSIHDPQIEISSGQFVPGIYFVKILAGDKFLSTQKVVVQ